MPNKPNDPFQFWEELKRRRVVRVIPVYAATAFILLELVDILSDPLRLPDWTLNFVLILLCIGFVISVILSWVYDVTPEGIQKTKPSKQVASVEAPPASKGWKIATFVSVLIIIAFVIFYIVGNNKKSFDISKLEKSIAVLPFENWSNSEEFSHLGNAIANEIITQLYKIREFHIPAFTSTSKFAGPDKPSVPQIGKELGVNFVIEGSIERQDENVSIHVQVIQAEIDDHIWAKEFKGKWEDIFKIRTIIAEEIAIELKTILTQDELDRIQNTPTLNLKAFDLFIKGRYYWNKRTETDLLLSLEYFEKAIKLDPEYAQAWAGLADTYAMLCAYNYTPSNEGHSKAKSAANEAIRVNPTLAEAHTTLGWVNAFYENDWDASKRSFELALNYEPSYATAHLWYAWALTIQGKFDEAKHHIQLARNLDPLSNIILASDGWIASLSGSYERANILLTSAIELNPDFPRSHLWLAYNYWVTEEFDFALFHLEQAVFLSKRHPQYLSSLGFLYGIIQQPEKAAEIKEEISEKSQDRFVSNYDLSLTFLGIHRVDLAMEYFEKAYQAKDMWVLFLSVDQRFSYLHSNPDFIRLVEKTGTNPNWIK